MSLLKKVGLVFAVLSIITLLSLIFAGLGLVTDFMFNVQQGYNQNVPGPTSTIIKSTSSGSVTEIIMPTVEQSYYGKLTTVQKNIGIFSLVVLWVIIGLSLIAGGIYLFNKD